LVARHATCGSERNRSISSALIAFDGVAVQRIFCPSLISALRLLY
jgi:hypothetical protein